MSEEQLVEALRLIDKLGFCIAKAHYVRSIPRSMRKAAAVQVVKHVEVVNKFKNKAMAAVPSSP